MNTEAQWIHVTDRPPPISALREKRYVLAVDIQSRMSVGYASQRSYGIGWTFAKPIGAPTHWMPLPESPHRIP